MFRKADRNSRSIDRGRRALVGAAALAAPLLWLPSPDTRASSKAARSVRMYHTHTGERISLTYLEDGEYVAEALRDINRFLRDFRTGEVHPINPRLLDNLHAMRRQSGSSGTFEIISGFRSPATNEMLRSKSTSSGVAKKSFHMTGNAVDVRLTGVDTKVLRDIAKSLRAGGVGFYARSDFIHIDTGRVRSW